MAGVGNGTTELGEIQLDIDVIVREPSGRSACRLARRTEPMVGLLAEEEAIVGQTTRSRAVTVRPVLDADALREMCGGGQSGKVAPSSPCKGPGSDGAAYVVLYDRRADPDNALPTVTLARSIDGGRTFTNYAWSVTPTDPKQANHGDYIGVAALNGRVYGAWTESAPAGQDTHTPVSRFFPSGPALIRIGIAEFRTPGRAKGADARRPE